MNHRRYFTSLPQSIISEPKNGLRNGAFVCTHIELFGAPGNAWSVIGQRNTLIFANAGCRRTDRANCVTASANGWNFRRASFKSFADCNFAAAEILATASF